MKSSPTTVTRVSNKLFIYFYFLFAHVGHAVPQVGYPKLRLQKNSENQIYSQKLGKVLLRWQSMSNITSFLTTRKKGSKLCELSEVGQAFRLGTRTYQNTANSSGVLGYLNTLLQDLPLQLQNNIRKYITDQAYSLYPEVTKSTLEECGWSKFVLNHFHNSSLLTGSKSHLLDFDSILTARLIQGNSYFLNNTCAIAWQGANTEYERLNVVNEDYANIVGNFTTIVSVQTHDIYKPMLVEYAGRMNTSGMRSWLSLASSNCSAILIVGHSLGGGLSIMHRIDIGDVQVETGKYLETCYHKHCKLISVISFASCWFGQRLPEFQKMYNSSRVIWYESDPTHLGLPKLLAELPSTTKKLINAQGLYVEELREPKNLLIVWRIRDFCISDKSYDYNVIREYDLPSDVTAQNFATTQMFRDRESAISQWGPLISFRFCPSPYAGKTFILTQSWCDHVSTLDPVDDFQRFNDVPQSATIEKYDQQTCIPDLPSSPFHTLSRIYGKYTLAVVMSKIYGF